MNYFILCFLGFAGCHGCVGGLEQAYRNEIRMPKMNNFLIVLMINIVVLIERNKDLTCNTPMVDD